MSLAKIVHRSGKSFKVEIEVSYKKSMLEGEEAIQEAINQAGCLMTGEMLCQFDTDGSPIQNVCDAVGAVAIAKEGEWEYAVPETEKPIKTISVGLDGTCMLMMEEGY